MGKNAKFQRKDTSFLQIPAANVFLVIHKNANINSLVRHSVRLEEFRTLDKVCASRMCVFALGRMTGALSA